MSKELYLITIFLILNFTAQLNLIPDKNFPLMVKNPSKGNNPSITIKFSFPSVTQNEMIPQLSGSPGLLNSQFIGLQFPSSLGSILDYDQKSARSCKLSDGINEYELLAEKAAASLFTVEGPEKNVAYCKLDINPENTPLKTGPEVIYTLTVETDPISVNYVRGLSLFTSTSNTPDKIIIDYLPLLGSIANYNSYDSIETPSLEIINSEIISPV